MNLSNSVILYACMGVVGLGASCGGEESKKNTQPAHVARIGEGQVNQVTLTEKAVERLGIRTLPARLETVPRTRLVGGEVIARPGAAAVVSAPWPGIVMTPRSGLAPIPGRTLASGEIVLRLAPTVAPNRNLRLEAQRDLQMAEARAEAAQQNAKRLKVLRREGAADQAADERAQAQATVANAELKAAKQRESRLRGANPLGADVTFPVRAARDSVLLRVHTAAGQMVAAGSPLFETADLSSVWVTVLVYIGDLPQIDRAAAATILPLGRRGNSPGFEARPIAMPAIGRPNTASAELHYEVVVQDHGLVPGQRVSVQIPLRGKNEARLVVPWTAVLYDIHGGAWVYKQSAPGEFMRERIEVDHVDGERAVLQRGPASGTPLVVNGASELFGTEFGVGK